MTDKSWTHKALVRRVAAWLRRTRGMPVVTAELTTATHETPDVIGWARGGGSVLVECKVSRGDFLGDHKKWFRQRDEWGMGDVRYVAAPRGMIRPEELPPGWGLLDVDDRFVRVVREATRVQANKRAEITMLVSVIRRLEIATAVFVRQEREDEE